MLARRGKSLFYRAANTHYISREA